MHCSADAPPACGLASLDQTACFAPAVLRRQELTPSPAEEERRAAVVQRVQATLGGVGAVTPFGSSVAGLHLPGADVDLSLEGWLAWWVAAPGAALLCAGNAAGLGRGHDCECARCMANIRSQTGHAVDAPHLVVDRGTSSWCAKGWR